MAGASDPRNSGARSRRARDAERRGRAGEAEHRAGRGSRVEPAVRADPAPVLREVRHLHGVTVRFWQDQLERTMATGQAITLCRSPQEAVRLQIAYAQASLASGLEHACRAARLSQDIARDMLPFHPRRARGPR